MRELGCTVKQIERLIPPTPHARVATSTRTSPRSGPSCACGKRSSSIRRCTSTPTCSSCRTSTSCSRSDAKLASVQACICNPFKVPRVSPFFTPGGLPLLRAQPHRRAARHGRRRPRSASIRAAATSTPGSSASRPDQGEFDKMMARAARPGTTPSTAFAEQDFLNVLYADQWEAVPYIYNTLKTWDHAHAGRLRPRRRSRCSTTSAPSPGRTTPPTPATSTSTSSGGTMRNLPEGASFRLPASAIPTQPMARRAQRAAAATAR